MHAPGVDRVTRRDCNSSASLCPGINKLAKTLKNPPDMVNAPLALLVKPYLQSWRINVIKSIFKIRVEMAAAHQQPARGATKVNIKQASILLVDDYPNNLFVMEVVLEDLQAQISKANSGEEVLELIKQEKFDLIIMDVKLPGINGFDTAAMVREQLRDLPILFLTGYADMIDRFDLCPGPIDFLAKPYNPVKLREKVLHLIGQRHSQRGKNNECLLQ
jgi:CheY-like chemotaxis protein